MGGNLVVTLGEPAGIGPEVFLKVISSSKSIKNLCVVTDPDFLKSMAKHYNLPIPEQLKILPCKLHAPVEMGKPNPDNAAFVIACLTLASQLCLTEKNYSLVTGPIHKATINEAGIPFKGHTEFLAEQAGVDHTIMMFHAPGMKVTLVTTHLPLSQVPKAITKTAIDQHVKLLCTELKDKFKINHPKIIMAGLNPHAGESGLLGSEEIETIIPAIKALQDQGFAINGPLPADTIFLPQHLANADVMIGLYHDQVLPVIKHTAFDNTVNVTLGLPFLRTSVDHGTACDIAGKGLANPGSMQAAINLAQTTMQ